MAQLAKERPIFHSEADFQHALAWAIHRSRPDAELRLERPLGVAGQMLHIDMCLVDGTHRYALELKYKAKRLDVDVSDEAFRLVQQGGHPCYRYDFVKDVRRLERIVAAGHVRTGFAIMLTNDSGYWHRATRASVCDAAFRLHDEAILGPGVLAWGEDTGKGTKQNREDPIPIDGSHRMRWRDYSDLRKLGVTEGSAGEFRYLLVRVPPPQSIATDPEE